MYRKILLVLASATLLATLGCAGKSAVKSPPATSTVGGSAGAGAQSSAATGESAAANAGTVGGTGGAGASAPAGVSRLVYFDFDSAEIRPEFVAVIAAHARAIAANASIHVRLEGHTDERGSPEYNIGLGERRAQAVRRARVLQGVGEAQVATVSYGEERPAVSGHTEADWAKNRRVEFVYLN
ncbi:MAG: peptidoglycan-associated lipoprotein Pal [Gammaproteobacteria bacterium]|nr:peptidoglycan-associated lipoprotein Pal [Gammaproteobacteria bacterium]